MLEELDIRNFALIESAHIEFKGGFTVLSGETGAGKSILVGSLIFLLGGRTSAELIRTGCKECSVSAVFSVEAPEGRKWLSERALESDDGRILIRRVLREGGRSSSWIQGVPCTRADLQAFAPYLADIHGQHEQQSLMRVSSHRRYLDTYAALSSEVERFEKAYNELSEKRHLLEKLNESEKTREERVDFLRYAISEIDGAKLRENEDEDLENEEKRLSSYEKLFSALEEIKGALEGEGGILSNLRASCSSARHASALDKTLEPLAGRLQSAFYDLDDVSNDLRRYKDSLVYDPGKLERVQQRQDLIFKLKGKYAGRGASVSDVIRFSEKAKEELASLEKDEGNKSVLEAEVASLEERLSEAANGLSGARRAAGIAMSRAVEQVLSGLGMADARFSVSIKERDGDTFLEKCGPYGIDSVEFLISANAGEPLMSLTKIASGGEISRVMLALKTILCDGDFAGTLVFDEIDSGIGGEVAVAVGRCLKRLASKRQVLCITHHASIAVFAGHQVKIEKGTEEGTTASNVLEVVGGARVREIARMLSGDSASQKSLEHAASMLKEFGGE